MNNELLLPDTLAVQMQKRLVQLQATLQKIRETQKQMPQGHLRVAQKGTKRPWFYLYTKPDDLTGKYIRKKNIEFAKQLAQKDYNSALIEQLEKETIALQEYLTQSQNGRAIPKLYEGLCPARQALITPATLTDRQYIAQWKSVTWQGYPFTADTPTYDTANGEQVRSKSEVIIADTLYRHGIPYRYEYPVKLWKGGPSTELRDHKGELLDHKGELLDHKGELRDHKSELRDHKLEHISQQITLHPDFTCLNVHTRQEFIWEHFGLMDDPEYAKNTAGKLRLYTENGILPGRNLIITMETQAEPISTRAVEKIISEFFIEPA